MSDKYFKVLELDSNASLEELETAYKSLIMVWHPDRFQQNDELRARAEEKTKEINEAYTELKAELRAQDYFSQKQSSSKSQAKKKNSKAKQAQSRQASSKQYQSNDSRGEKTQYDSKYKRAVKKKSGFKYLYLGLFSLILWFGYQNINPATLMPENKEEKAIIKVIDGSETLELNSNGRYKIIKVAGDASKRSALLNAVLACDKAEVSKMLVAGQKINQVDEDGNTPLIWAVRRGCLEVVQLLINKNADVNKKSSNGFSAIMWANLYKRESLKELLIKSGSESLPDFWDK